MTSALRHSLFFLLAGFATPAFAADVTVELDAGTGFVVQNNGASVERLRVDEATGNVSRNGALFVHTTGAFGSTFVGADAGNLTSTGSADTAFGSRVLTRNTTGSHNSAFGRSALYYNTTGSQNSAFGRSALYYNTTGSENSSFGAFALSNTTGSNNSAFGASALNYNTTGSNNSAFGRKALYANQLGSMQSAFGARALYGAASNAGSRNSAFGAYALAGNEYGYDNAAFGALALGANYSGSDNAAFGYGALGSNSFGGANTAVGRGSLSSNIYGSDNVAIGHLAGSNQTTGNDNIYLSNLGVATESGRIKIGNSAHTATYVEGIDGVTLGAGSAVYIDASNRLGTAVSSSLRTKRDVVDMGDASAVVAELRPVLFRYRPDVVSEPEAKVLHYGLVAEEVAAVAPQLVTYDDEGKPDSVQYRLLTPLLLNELQRQRQTMDEERASNEARIATLLARLDALESQLENASRLATR